MKHYLEKIQQSYYKNCFRLAGVISAGIAFIPNRVLADESPFGNMGIDAADLESKANSTTSTTLEYIILGCGVLLCVIGALKLIGIATRDVKDKEEHGNSLIGIFILVLCVFLGLVLIGIGWKGASATPS